jgi:1,4-alpha-glucan branching enzyme
MATKDEAMKTAAKAAKMRKPGKGLKIFAADSNARAETQKKEAAQNEPSEARAKAGTTFRLEAPRATQVCIAGCFNKWDPTANPLERDGGGTWRCALAIEPGEYEYRFVVDGVWWDDPANVSRRWNDFGTQNCVLMVQG